MDYLLKLDKDNFRDHKKLEMSKKISLGATINLIPGIKIKNPN